ncbi:hypothetical protein Syun_015038 [Stephania yunnanensis]|uniref:Uncharacterized protein n=1 Tax=Stephania yunnanensis TaxID=152371 RepID=A0AAP0JM60_9MAGN
MPFLKANMYENFGDKLGMNIKKMVDEFRQDGYPAKIMLLYFAEDVPKFVDNYPEYIKKHGNVS